MTMPTYRMGSDGKLVDVDTLVPDRRGASHLPRPAIHNFESYASPIDGQTVRSNRERDRDLTNSGSYDPRDTPAAFRKARDARRQSKRPSATRQ